MIKSRLRIPLFLAASVLFCVSSAKAQDKVLLRMNLQPGQTFDQGMVMETKSSQNIQQKRMEMTSTSRFELHNEVLAVDADGNIKLKITYQRLAIKSQGTFDGKPLPVENYDSKNSSKSKVVSEGSAALTRLVGLSVVETMSPEGKVLHLDGMDAVVQRIVSGTKNPQQRAIMQKTISHVLESTSKSSTQTVRFPEAAVGIGDSWTSVISGQAPIQISMKYTLMSSKNGVATLAMRSTFFPNPNAPTLDMPMFKMKNNVSGSLNGVIRVDEKTGLAISSELHQDMKNVAVITAAKSTSKSKPAPPLPSSITSYTKGVIRSWTVKLPQ